VPWLGTLSAGLFSADHVPVTGAATSAGSRAGARRSARRASRAASIRKTTEAVIRTQPTRRGVSQKKPAANSAATRRKHHRLSTESALMVVRMVSPGSGTGASGQVRAVVARATSSGTIRVGGTS
jgi:sRNA-binding protein